jgi:hypothetical protein
MAILHGVRVLGTDIRVSVCRQIDYCVPPESAKKWGGEQYRPGFSISGNRRLASTVETLKRDPRAEERPRGSNVPPSS